MHRWGPSRYLATQCTVASERELCRRSPCRAPQQDCRDRAEQSYGCHETHQQLRRFVHFRARSEEGRGDCRRDRRDNRPDQREAAQPVAIAGREKIPLEQHRVREPLEPPQLSFKLGHPICQLTAPLELAFELSALVFGGELDGRIGADGILALYRLLESYEQRVRESVGMCACAPAACSASTESAVSSIEESRPCRLGHPPSRSSWRRTSSVSITDMS